MKHVIHHMVKASDTRPHGLESDGPLDAASGIVIGAVIGWIMWAALTVGVLFAAGVLE